MICLPGGDEGPLAAAIVRGGEDKGRMAVEQLLRIFGRGECLCRATGVIRSGEEAGEIRLVGLLDLLHAAANRY